jgi:hypothetical protein
VKARLDCKNRGKFDSNINKDYNRRNTPNLAATVPDYGKRTAQFKRRLWKFNGVLECLYAGLTSKTPNIKEDIIIPVHDKNWEIALIDI